MEPSSPVNITAGGKERVPQAAQLLSKAFEADPVIRYMLASLPDSRRLAYLPSYFASLLTAAALNSAVFEEAADWASCAVWLPPGKRVDHPATLLPAGGLRVLWTLGVAGCRKMLLEFSSQTAAAKAKGLNGQKRYYYLFFVGTRTDSRGKGLSSALIKRYQAVAARDGLPIWLEATTPYSSKIYTRLGFQTVQEMVLGKGSAAADGSQSKGGEGVRVWAMVWWPPKQEEA